MMNSAARRDARGGSVTEKLRNPLPAVPLRGPEACPSYETIFMDWVNSSCPFYTVIIHPGMCKESSLEISKT